MSQALRAADLVLSRAGASVLGEYPLLGLPAILVPYPHAWRYQKINADYLVTRGAAIRLDDGDLSTGLLPLLTSLWDDPQHLHAMQAGMQALARSDAAAVLARALVELRQGERHDLVCSNL
jgi:UDP-N-acetylglucosamine--N-acetylmuramyl-(pentapeptide) pyrophosphoryl-undecaprenol N-acetylglucosamine transferase